MPPEINTPLLFIVDDDPEERYLMQMALSEIGWEDAVFFFHSAEACLHHLALLHPDRYPSLLLVDYHMPGINGGELLQMLKESRSFNYLPVVVYSTHLTSELHQELLRSGAAQCFHKAQSYQEAIGFAQFIKRMCLERLEPH